MDETSDSSFPKVTFGIIVLNGEPFTRYCLRSLYPYAHQIVVVEGAVRGAMAVARPDGHSRDGTLETLQRFKREEDPEDKLVLVTREGGWSEKDEQSRAYADIASGDWLWQVDIDEFYLPRDMEFVFSLLRERPETTAASFRQIAFWGSPNHICDSTYLLEGGDVFHRLFRWRPGFRYLTHRPPTVVDEAGVDLREINPLRAEDLQAAGVRLYHYWMLFPKQVREKVAYYATWAGAPQKAMPRWMEENYFDLRNPFNTFNVTNHPGWLERYDGDHPPQAAALWRDALRGELGVELRPMADADALLADQDYRRGIFAVRSEYNRRNNKRLTMSDPALRPLLQPGWQPRLRVAMLSTHESTGGAAQVQFHLGEGLLRHDCAVRGFVRHLQANAPWTESFHRPALDPPQAAQRTPLLDYGLVSSFYLAQKRGIRDADVIHAHNLHGGYFNPLTLPLLNAAKPMVWTLHDMQALTGHCAYSMECEGWKTTGCRRCEHLDIYPELSRDVAGELYRDKRVMASLLDLCIVTPSQWLMDRVQESFLAKLPSAVIFNGINTEAFRPLKREECRALLGLPQDAFILVCTANGGMGNVFKGGSYLEQAARALQEVFPKLLLLNVGGSYAAPGLRMVNLPYLADKAALAVAYNAGDVFAFPSLADTAPLTVVEAMACGLPVVSFRTGGVPELTLDGETGFTVGYKDLPQFIAALRQLATHPQLRRTMSANAAARGASFTLGKSTAAYLALYEQVLERRARQGGPDVSRNRRALEYLQSRLAAVGNAPGVAAYARLLGGNAA